EARAFDNIYHHFDELYAHFLQPDAWSILANLIYWSVLILIAVAKALSLAVIAFGLVASAVCGLLGPIFVPFFIVPKLDWLFWGWLKSFIPYSFIPVVAIAFLMIFEAHLWRWAVNPTFAGPNPKTLDCAKPQFAELHGSALVMNTYLKVAGVLLALVALGLIALNFRTMATYANVKPLVVRIDDVG